MPAERATELWKNYQLYVEQYYDLLKLGHELRDYDFKKNLETKMRLIQQAEALAENPDVLQAFNQLQTLHQEWKETGPVAKEIREDVWAKFKEASTIINKKHQAYFDAIKAREEENLTKKTALCEQLEAFDTENLKNFADWDGITQKIKELQAEWKTIGFAPQKMNTAIFERFRQGCDAFFEKKNAFFKDLKEELNTNLAKKKELVEKAEALMESTDWRSTGDILINLQKQWKEIGTVPRKYSEDLWKRFTSACDHFFEARQAATADVRNEEKANKEEKLGIIDQLKHVKGLNVFRTTKSYTGREHYAIELRPDRTGYISRTKRITAHQTELIICRHHANEVSSTNEAFMLLRELLTNDKYSDLTEQMNLTIVPMDNVDGAALHYELQQDNPTWKLHIARFNAIGKEFYHDHFKMDTIHTEALGLRRLFMTLLPDALIDNHGVPSHEWEQQFAGYTSPSFRGFWLPRSLLYGYFYHITGDEYAYNIKLNERIQDVIADNYLDNEEVTRENKLWARQFEKYAHGWMPKMFPATYYKNMINYWIPSPYNPEHRYPSIRFPWILSLDYVSEVADETAQGEYLNRCARAHLEHDKAIIGSLRNAHKVYREEWNFSDSDVRAELTRKRPIFVD